MLEEVPTKIEAISEEEFANLLEDKTFVDFFNVFLSLPTFSQRLTYIYDKKHFEFDPPLKRREYALERHNLVLWLLRERVPYFLQSDLHLEYSLCKKLLTTKLHASDSSHRIDYDTFEIMDDQEFIWTCVGHVVGMCQLRDYLAGTSGERIMEFWKDAERFHRLPVQNTRMRRALFREIQLRYFEIGGITKLKDNRMWKVIEDGAKVVQSDQTMDGQGVNDTGHSFRQLQETILVVFQEYWLHRYLLHCYAVRQKKGLPPEDACKIRSLSDLTVFRDLRNINRTLDLAAASFKPNSRTTSHIGAVNWHAMFPHTTVDDSFLAPSEEVVTLHNDGKVTVKRMDSKFDMMLDRYFDETDSDSDTETKSTRSEESPVFSWDLPSTATWSTQERPGPARKTPEEETAELVRQIATGVAELEEKSSSHSDSSLSQSDDLEKNVKEEEQEEQQEERTAKSQPIPKRPRTCLAVHFSLTSGDTWSRGTASVVDPIDLETAASAKKYAMKFKRKVRSKTDDKTKVKLKVGQSMRPKRSRGLPAIVKYPPANLTESRWKNADDIQLPDEMSLQFRFTNLCAGNYRYDNKVIMGALVMDAVCGRPFATYLHRYHHTQALTCVRFWGEAHAYLSIKATFSDAASADRLRFWRAHKLILRFLNKQTNSREAIVLPPGLHGMLRRLLSQGKGDELLRQAQDYVCQTLHQLWKSFTFMDKELFIDSALGRKINRASYRRGFSKPIPPTTLFGQSSPPPIILPPLRTATQSHLPKPSAKENDQIGQPAQTNDTNGTKDEGNPENRDDKSRSQNEPARDILTDQEDHVALQERRMWRALQLVAFVTAIDTEQLLIKGLPVTEAQYNADSIYGSLALHKVVVVRRRDILEAEARRKEIRVHAYVEKMAKQKAKDKEDVPKEMTDEDVPVWAKPYRGENRRWILRPARPRTISELLRCPIQVEFFRRYLQAEGADARLNFWISVESMKLAKDPTYRQQKINQIIRRFFLSPRGYASLEYNDDVIKEIPKMEKVTPAMLISGQSCIARLIEEEWFIKYQCTFPEPDPSTLTNAATKEGDGVKRTWTKENTRALWMSFVRLVSRFQSAILDPVMSKLFVEYLRIEIKREFERQRAGGTANFMSGLPIKKVIRNRLIDVTKLINDLSFLAEAERYRRLCDNAAQAVKQGTYRTEDQQLLELKARTIIDCFLDSELPPRIQVNASADFVDDIITTFSSGMVDRSLFHCVYMGIFPVLAHLWRKSQRYRFACMFKMPEVAQIDRKETPEPPDFFEFNVDTTRKIISLHEEDHPRILFSLSNGLRLINPPTREHLLRDALEGNPRFRRASAIPGDGGSISRLSESQRGMSRSVMASRATLSRRTSTIPADETGDGVSNDHHTVSKREVNSPPVSRTSVLHQERRKSWILPPMRRASVRPMQGEENEMLQLRRGAIFRSRQGSIAAP